MITGPQVSPQTPHFLIVFTAHTGDQASMQTAPDIIACPNTACTLIPFFFFLFLFFFYKDKASLIPSCQPHSGECQRNKNNKHRSLTCLTLSNNRLFQMLPVTSHYCETKGILGDSAGSAPSCPRAKEGHLQVNNNTLKNDYAELNNTTERNQCTSFKC